MSNTKENRAVRVARSMAVFSFLPLLTASCLGLPEESDNEDYAEAGDELMGEVYTTGLGAAQIAFNEDIMFFARTAVASPAFRECVNEAMSSGFSAGGAGTAGPYMYCNGDPGQGLSITQQHEMLMQVARSDNDVLVGCQLGVPGANASTGQNDGFNHQNTEEFNWHNWFEDVRNQLDDPLCEDTNNQQPCRYAAYPWPYSQAAGIAVHEVLHTHGYGHGHNSSNTLAQAACGQSGSFHFQVNTMPYLVDKCVSYVIDKSAEVCGSVDRCGDGELNLIESIHSTACSCVQDRRFDDVAMADLNGTAMSAHSTGSVGQSFGGWLFGIQDQIVAFADLDGNGTDEWIVRSGWGLGDIRDSGSGFTLNASRSFASTTLLNPDIAIVATGNFDSDAADELLARDSVGLRVLERSGSLIIVKQTIPWGTSLPGGWSLGASNSFYEAADFDGNAGDEVLVRSTWGIGVLRFSSGTLVTLALAPHNTTLGGWSLSSDDEIRGAGDFDGDGKSEILIRGAAGVGLLRVNGSSFTSSVAKSNGSWFGTWHLGEDDDFAAIGRFGGGSKDQVLVRSAWGIGLLEQSGSSFASVMTKQHNTFWGGWRSNALDRVEGVGDFDNDGRDDFVLRSDWGVGILSSGSGSSTFANTKSVVPYGGSYGTWTLGADDVIMGTADLDGDGKAGLLLRN